MAGGTTCSLLPPKAGTWDPEPLLMALAGPNTELTVASQSHGHGARDAADDLGWAVP